MDELADRMVPARDLRGSPADALLEQLVAAAISRDQDPTRACLEALEGALEGRLQGPDVFEPASAAGARAAVQRLSLGGATLEETASALHISPRNLRRAFVATVGVSPKRCARITRFQRVVSNLLSQGDQERLHPGTPTFGSTQFHGREFPPTTWKHTLEHNAAAEQEAEQKKSEQKK